MKNEDLITEISSLLALINEAREKTHSDHEKFQVALTNTLRLLNGSSQILTKMAGNTEDLKAYLIRMSTSIQQTSSDSLNQLRLKAEKIRDLIQNL